jgi:hypothetical protein
MIDGGFVITLFYHSLILPNLKSIHLKFKKLCLTNQKPNNQKSFKTTDIYDDTEIDSLIGINTMSGKDFEIFLKNLFRKMNFSAELTPSTHDHGADIILSKNGERIAVQAKRYQGTVPNAAVMQCHYAMKHYGCKKGLIVTNSIFSDHARQEALVADIQLIEGRKLKHMIRTYMNAELKKAKDNLAYSKNNLLDNTTSQLDKKGQPSNLNKNVEADGNSNDCMSYDDICYVERKQKEFLMKVSIGNIVDASINIFPEDGNYTTRIFLNNPSEKDIRNIIKLISVSVLSNFLLNL